MNYLKHFVSASAPGLLVVAKYLATCSEAVTEQALGSVLAPFAITEKEDAGAALKAALPVGEHLGLFEVRVDGGRRRSWSLHDSVRGVVEQADGEFGTRRFYALVLRLLGERARSAVEAREQPSDLARALTWLLQRDPLRGWSTAWGEGTEKRFTEGGMKSAVDTKEQWAAVVRWVSALGLGNQTATGAGRSKGVVMIDPSRAIRDVLATMPVLLPADEWLRQLYAQIPVLGDHRLVEDLPEGSKSTSGVPGAVALALRKLELEKRVELVSSADAMGAAFFRLGKEKRVGHIRVLEVTG
ncbi:protein DpdG [Actinosynnema sp. NPDC002837]